MLFGENDWVLVYDVVRFCIEESDIFVLFELMSSDDVFGGILVIFVCDIMKWVRFLINVIFYIED